MCPGTVDERVEEVVAGKRQIADLVLPKSSSIGDLDTEQLQVALGIDVDQLLTDDESELTSDRDSRRHRSDLVSDAERQHQGLGPVSPPWRTQSTERSQHREQRRRRGAKGRPEIPDDFWGDVDSVPDTAGTVHITHAPAAVVQSLGRVPLPGHEVPAEHTFKLVYDYAVNLASTLAVAGELIDPEELQGSNGG